MIKEKIENISVYMTIKNGSAQPERLIKVETSLAERVDLVDIQCMSGMKLPTSVAILLIPPRGELEFRRAAAAALPVQEASQRL